MSVICLICKDKLLNNSPGSPIGSLNSLVENQAIATGCGHLYHFECLQCWFRTQKKKLFNQGFTGNFPDHCPTCQSEVQDDQIRRIYLLEDHRESLERAKLLEKLENLEIYCHQLEVHVQQLQRENDLLINKALAPPSSARNDDFAAIVKNDKVMWLKKSGPPVSGVVLTIFKKDGSLWVKIKLDKKIRTNQRSGLFGSFRFNKKHELTVPFEEIVLEKDCKKNNLLHGSGISSEPTSPTIGLQKMPPFFRSSSTLSLPGEYVGGNFGGRTQVGIRPISSYDIMNSYGSTFELSHSIAEHPEGNFEQNPIDTENTQTSAARLAAKTVNDFLNSSEANEADGSKPNIVQRDYVLFTPPRSPKLEEGSSGDLFFASTPQLHDIKTKHVTFADDLLLMEKKRRMSALPQKGNHFRDHDYKNVIEMSGNLEAQDSSVASTIAQLGIELKHQAAEQERPVISQPEHPEKMPNFETDSIRPPLISFTEPPNPSLSQSSPVALTQQQNDVLIDAFEQLPKSPDLNFNRSCFDMTFSLLFYQSQVFDKLLVLRDPPNDEIQDFVQQILAMEFVATLRDPERQQYKVGYSDRLHEVISHLCSTYLDLEELMTILFEYVFKIPPFIGYSFDMCDYIHQFFIDFTDKERTPTVQQLLERSLLLQDGLKLREEPKPALLLQMPNSENGIIIHYDAVLPSLTLNIENLLEKDSMKSDGLACYCNKTATLECATCAKIHGKSPVLFCEDCSVLLEAIHDQLYHKLDLVPIHPLKLSSSTLALSGVICLKDGAYSVFLRDVDSAHSKWKFIEEFKEGRPKIVELPKLDDWIELICSDPANLEVKSLDPLQRKLMTECRMFYYLPIQNSFA